MTEPQRAADADGPRVATTVVLPIYRNLPHLPELTARLAAALGAGNAGADGAQPFAAPWEIVCVDDCGGDGAREWIAAREREDPRIRLVANARNLGQHASVLAGLRAARGERTVVMDADLQDAPEDVPALLSALGPGAAAVFARRLPEGAAGTSSWSGRAFKALLRGISGSRIPEGTGMFIALRGDARDAVLRIAADRPYLPLLLARTGLPLAAVDVVRHGRAVGTSSYSWHRRLRMGCRATAQAIRWRLFER